MTSKQTEPDLFHNIAFLSPVLEHGSPRAEGFTSKTQITYSSSIFGWNIRFTKPILGDLYGYWSGSSTWTFHVPFSKGAIEVFS